MQEQQVISVSTKLSICASLSAPLLQQRETLNVQAGAGIVADSVPEKSFMKRMRNPPRFWMQSNLPQQISIWMFWQNGVTHDSVLDNYDSFTYNLVQLAGIFTQDISVFRNDAIDIEKIKIMHPQGIIISPGPGRPEQAGITMDVIRSLGSTIPNLAYASVIKQSARFSEGQLPMHRNLFMGKLRRFGMTASEFLKGFPNPSMQAVTICLSSNATACRMNLKSRRIPMTDLIMAMRHRKFPICGVQFHPESILTPAGKTIMKNWIGTFA